MQSHSLKTLRGSEATEPINKLLSGNKGVGSGKANLIGVKGFSCNTNCREHFGKLIRDHETDMLISKKENCRPGV